MGWCFYSHLLYFGVQTGTNTSLFNRGLWVYVYGVVLLLASFVLRCTNRHRNKPIFSCLCLWGGAFTRILYFGVQTGTNTSLFNRGLVVYVYGVVLLLASFVLRCTNRHQNKPILSCLCLWDCAFTRILYFGVQKGTKQT